MKVIYLLLFVFVQLRQSLDCSTEGGKMGGDGRSTVCLHAKAAGKAEKQELFSLFEVIE